MERITIVKVGGKVIEESESLNALLDRFCKISGNKILVHGGGRSATELAKRLGIETQMIEGRRVTDSATLEVVTMVYGGLVNKRIIAELQARGVNSVGLTGADLDLIRAEKMSVGEIDYGFVGEVSNVNTRELRLLISENIIPVVAPLTHDGKGNMLNTNADTIASELAVELTNYFNVYLFYCFEKKGVLSVPDDDDSVINYLDSAMFAEYKENGIVSAGMIPKLENGFKAKLNGVKEVLITNPDNIANGKGTRIV